MQANAEINKLNETIAAYQTTLQTVSDMLGHVCDAEDEGRAELDARVHEVDATSAAAAVAPAAICERKAQVKAAGSKKHKKRLQKFKIEAADLTLDNSERRDNCEASIENLLLADATVGEQPTHTCHLK
jgi:hypothetical protein